MADDRRFDIVLWGATGFVGGLTAEVLSERYPDVTWAIAGRSRSRLEEVRDRYDLDVEILVGDALDRDSLDAIAQATRVVCTTVGPYAKYGSDLVAACVDAGTHYCDLTGEVPWVREMIDRHHEAAAASGARITHFCGFDSIPSDLGAWVLNQAAEERFGKPVERDRMYVLKAKGGFSGGTLASMTNIVKQARSDKALRRLLFDPYALNPDGERSGPDGRDLTSVAWDEDIDAWVGPFIMGTVNSRVVRRSNALLGYDYGRDFQYDEVTRFGRGLKGRLAGAGVVAGMGALTAGLALGPIRSLLQATVLPDPGEGPSPETIESGQFHCRHIGHVDGETVTVDVRGSRDPGYGATAAMLAASAVCLAKDDLDSGGGILTPAAAMGQHLVDRLNADGEVTVEIED